MKHWKPEDVIDECRKRGFTLVNRSFAKVVAELLNDNPKDRPPKVDAVVVWKPGWRP